MNVDCRCVHRQETRAQEGNLKARLNFDHLDTAEYKNQ